MSRNKALIIASDGLTTNLLYEVLSKDFDLVKVLIEEKEGKNTFIKYTIVTCILIGSTFCT